MTETPPDLPLSGEGQDNLPPDKGGMREGFRPKLLAIASPGGHWIQLTRLCQGLADRYDIVYATPAVFGKAHSTGKTYAIMDVSADDKWRLMPCAWQILRILWKERPQAILTTGAAPGAVAVWLGSFLGIRTIWVDSIANVKQLSRAGRLAQWRADVFLTQWEHLADGQRVLYKGAVL